MRKVGLSNRIQYKLSPNCVISSDRTEVPKHFAITLGANRAPIDSVRAIQNASSGRTGWAIAEYLFRFGHDITVIAGKTSANPSFTLPNVIRAGTPDGMLSACVEVATQNPSPDGWIHSAAVLDYFAPSLDMKKPSGDDSWTIELNPGRKHIAELAKYVQGKRRIGFKLETVLHWMNYANAQYISCKSMVWMPPLRTFSSRSTNLILLEPTW